MRSISFVLILTLLVMTVSCSTTRVIAPQELGRPAYPKDCALKLTYRNGSVVLVHVFVVDWPVVEGEIDELHGEVPRQAVSSDPKRFRFDVSEADLVQRYEFSRGKTVGLVAAVVVGLMVVVLIETAIALGRVFEGFGSGSASGELRTIAPRPDSEHDAAEPFEDPTTDPGLATRPVSWGASPAPVNSSCSDFFVGPSMAGVESLAHGPDDQTHMTPIMETTTSPRTK